MGEMKIEFMCFLGECFKDNFFETLSWGNFRRFQLILSNKKNWINICVVGTAPTPRINGKVTGNKANFPCQDVGSNAPRRDTPYCCRHLSVDQQRQIFLCYDYSSIEIMFKLLISNTSM
jgi:hypothetical protein